MAWCVRVQFSLMLANPLVAPNRPPGGVWFPPGKDAGARGRDFVKWAAFPGSLTHFGESAVRAYNIAMTPPMAPVLLVLDTEMQEAPIPTNKKLVIPKLPRIAPLIGDPGAVAEAAQLLVDAANPVIIADRLVRSQ